MKLHVLGTGHATVTKNYNTCFVMENENKYLLVDAGGGNGILKQLKKMEINLNDIEVGFITHKHSDHIVGYIWIIRMVLQGYLKGIRTKDFTLYGNENCLNAIESLCKLVVGEALWNKFINKKFFLKEVKDEQFENIIGLNFTFFDCRYVEKEFPQMAFYIKEKQFAFCGDVPLNEYYYKKFKDLNWLCLEAFCLESERIIDPLPLTKHKTVMEAAQIANKLHPANLILWHGGDDKGNRKELYIKEAKQYFAGEIYVPDDLDVLDI